jgi:hypothetical protein
VSIWNVVCSSETQFLVVCVPQSLLMGLQEHFKINSIFKFRLCIHQTNYSIGFLYTNTDLPAAYDPYSPNKAANQNDEKDEELTDLMGNFGVRTFGRKQKEVTKYWLGFQVFGWFCLILLYSSQSSHEAQFEQQLATKCRRHEESGICLGESKNNLVITEIIVL